MHKAIYTVDEDLSGVTYLIFFAILWYSFLLRVTITSGFQTRIYFSFIPNCKTISKGILLSKISSAVYAGKYSS